MQLGQYMKNKTLTIRVSGDFIDTLNKLCNKYNISQSKCLELCLYIISDTDLNGNDIKNEMIIKLFTRG